MRDEGRAAAGTFGDIWQGGVQSFDEARRLLLAAGRDEAGDAAVRSAAAAVATAARERHHPTPHERAAARDPLLASEAAVARVAPHEDGLVRLLARPRRGGGGGTDEGGRQRDVRRTMLHRFFTLVAWLFFEAPQSLARMRSRSNAAGRAWPLCWPLRPLSLNALRQAPAALRAFRHSFLAGGLERGAAPSVTMGRTNEAHPTWPCL